MYWICMDLASQEASLALHLAGDKSLIEEINLGGHPCENLVPELDTLFKKHGVKLDSVRRFISVVGPGSFTGLRIGQATLKAFALSHSIPIETVSGSEVRALYWLHSQKQSPAHITVITKASATRSVVSIFEVVGKQLNVLFEDIVTDLAEAPIPTDSVRLPNEYQLSAKQILVVFDDLRTRHEHNTELDLIQLSPQYFGDPYRAKTQVPSTKTQQI